MYNHLGVGEIFQDISQKYTKMVRFCTSVRRVGWLWEHDA